MALALFWLPLGGRGGALAAPVFEEFTEAFVGGGGATSVVLSTPAGTVQGDLLIAAVSVDEAPILLAPGAGGWSELSNQEENSQVRFGVWWKQADAAEPATHTWTWSGTGNEQAYGYIMRFTGHDPAAPIDSFLEQGGFSSNSQALGLTVTDPDALILRLGGFDGDAVTIGDAGMTGHTTITMNVSGGGGGPVSSGAAWAPRGGSSNVPSAIFTLTASVPWRTVSLAIVPPQVTQVCGNGTPEGTEQCDDGNTAPGDCCSATCQFEAAATVCRGSVDVCDAAEQCTGTSGSCPADAFEPATTECRAATDVCDAAEQCTGTSASCPADVLEPATTECRASADVCDVAEQCTGASASCPADAFEPGTTVCRSSTGICDLTETCTGFSASCPGDLFAPATAECRGSAGVCDVAEQCTGTSGACPADAFEPAATECRASAGVCDVAEQCAGTSASCPVDDLEPGGTVCRAAVGLCDHVETCSGTSAACPADTLLAFGSICRPAQGPCDVTDFCRFSSDCPDSFRLSTFVCRAAVDICDLAENCPGDGPSCPADELVQCDDGLSCTLDSCVVAQGGCVNEPQAGCAEPVPATPRWGLALIALLSAGIVLAAQRRRFGIRS